MVSAATRRIAAHLRRQVFQPGYNVPHRKTIQDIPKTMRVVAQTGYGAPSDSLSYYVAPTPNISPYDVRFFYNVFFILF